MMGLSHHATGQREGGWDWNWVCLSLDSVLFTALLLGSGRSALLASELLILPWPRTSRVGVSFSRKLAGT